MIKDKIGSNKITTLKESGIEDYKKTAEYWLNLGNAYDDLGKHKEAIESYKLAIRINSDLAEPHNNLGIAYGKLGMHKEAIESFEHSAHHTYSEFPSHL